MGQILLVEGNDDLHVCMAIFGRRNIKETFEIKSTGGYNNLLKSLPVYLKTDYRTIGILLDADINISARWESVRGILSRAGYDIPVNFPAEGLVVVAENLPSIGLWIMPDNRHTGILEDFIEMMIPDDDNLIEEVEKALNSIELKNLNRYKEADKPKAKVHTWLAWQKDPGTPIGQAITKQYLNPDSPAAIFFTNWINKLFNC